MAITFSTQVKSKLARKHNVATDEVRECIMNRSSGVLEDDRETHKTDPPTQWFIAETDKGRKLKVAFILEENNIIIRTAYEPNDIEQQIYDTHTANEVSP